MEGDRGGTLKHARYHPHRKTRKAIPPLRCHTRWSYLCSYISSRATRTPNIAGAAGGDIHPSGFTSKCRPRHGIRGRDTLGVKPNRSDFGAVLTWCSPLNRGIRMLRLTAHEILRCGRKSCLESHGFSWYGLRPPNPCRGRSDFSEISTVREGGNSAVNRGSEVAVFSWCR